MKRMILTAGIVVACIALGLGYDVIELDEGFNAWKKAGKPVVIE